MKDRIKELRKALKLTQAEFGKRLNLSNNYIYLLESGSVPVSDNVVILISNVYKINENWLRTGEGSMFNPEERETEIAEITARLYKEDDPFKCALIKIISQMNEDQIELLKDIARKLAEAENKKPSAD